MKLKCVCCYTRVFDGFYVKTVLCFMLVLFQIRKMLHGHMQIVEDVSKLISTNIHNNDCFMV